ncbi:MAG: ATP phosphoribosyltransferase regulatory subunit [Armatimonadota bacterium]|nr:ATP phosphoribosyltransferase regulatory subunit [Armatimonadota bacterium]MDR5703390.1 ATP phosphoribosyltransferase regulatory subunit [Armatimonadota bacterium]MDR7434747.1 ATP phosphoribosyltransferase regulatory subunit [Armatimonadota bacterium]
MRLQNRKGHRYLQPPPGMRDRLPEEAESVLALQEKLRRTFTCWGYREVTTPTLEYLETIVRGAGEGVVERLFKLIGIEGELLALRPEMTIPIARLVATRLNNETLPLRLCYFSSIFRGKEARGDRPREYTQAGVELIGATGIDADAEVIALAVEAMQQAGVEEFQIGIGHVGFLKELLANGIEESDQTEIKELLYRQDFVSLRERLEELDVDQGISEAVLRLPEMRGSRALEEAHRLCPTKPARAALEELQNLLEVLRDYCPGARIQLDLGIIRDFTYYTGVVFEGYAGGLGYPLLGGGRYDGLLGRFGLPLPATGFAMDVDRILATWAPVSQPRRGVLVYVHKAERARGLDVARRLRGQGIVVVMEVTGRSWEESCQAARAQGLLLAARIKDQHVTIRHLQTREEWSVPLDAVEAVIRGRSQL